MKLGLRLAIALGALVAAPLHAQVVSCPPNGGGGDLLDRGFYVQNYGASTLGSVTLQYVAFTTGQYTLSLTANAGAYDGPLIATGIVKVNVGGGDSPATFFMGNVPVTPGSTIAFTQHIVSGPGAIFFDTGNGGLGVMDNTCPNVIETEGTSPPLDTFRRNSVALTIEAIAIGVSGTAQIPTLSGWMLALLACMLAGLGLMARQRS